MEWGRRWGTAFALGLFVAGCGDEEAADMQTSTSGPTTGVDGSASGGSTDAATGDPQTGATEVSTGSGADADASTGEIQPPEPVAVVLPVEVLGPPGTQVSQRLQLDAEQASGDAIVLTVHRAGFAWGHSPRAGETKARFRINRGPWVEMRNDTCDVSEPEAHYGGIGGGYATTRLRVDASFVEGENSLDFELVAHDGVSIGYRVVGLQILRGEEPLLSPGAVLLEDPVARDPVVGDAERGGELWAARDTLLDAGGVAIQAACADCHAADGRDLAFFHYSNVSIIERSLFHGLTAAQGEDIASYIRQLDDVAPGSARPWNPPYQPGPGLDGLPLAEWAAGAGLGAVLEQDAQTWSYLEPALDNLDSQATLNIRTMPVAVQFPDWNAWLPQVHPLDIWGATFESGDAEDEYVELRRTLPALVAAGDAEAVAVLGSLDDGVRRFIGFERTDDTGQGPWRTLEGTHVDAVPETIGRERAKLALSQWLGVKTWEQVQLLGLEDQPSVLLPPMGGTERGELRGWPSDGQSVWANAPHMTADDKRAFVDQPEVVGLFESSVWYQLQLTLNAGMRLPSDTRPMDWAYHFLHLVRLAEASGEPQVMRHLQSSIKARQARDNGYGPSTQGWQLRFLHPWLLYSDDSGDTEFFAAYDEVAPGLRARVLETFVDAWVDMVETRPEFELSTWPRRDPDDFGNDLHLYWFALESSDYVPVEWSGEGDLFEQPNYNHADAFFRLLPRLEAEGVEPNILGRLRTWCSQAWPQGAW